MSTKLRIAVDFDGTIAHHEFPDIGDEIDGAIEWLKKWKGAGAELILWTMRHDGQKFGEVLTMAVEWCRTRGLEFDSVNTGIDDRTWTDSPKVWANVYIDDAAFGCPLKESATRDRAYADWSVIGPEVDRLINGSE